MNSQASDLPADALLREAETRLTQALDNFFQRSHAAIQDLILRAIGQLMTPSSFAIGQTCVDWLNANPDTMSAAFSDQFRQQINTPERLAHTFGSQPAELQLVDDDRLGRQLAEDKMAARLSEDLLHELVPLLGRLRTLQQDAEGGPDYTAIFGPHSIVRALSCALDSLHFDSRSGTFLLQHATLPLRDTLKHTYAALNQYLSEQGVEKHSVVIAPPTAAPSRIESGAGQEILAHLQSLAEQAHSGHSASAAATAGTGMPASGADFPAQLPRFLDSLTQWQANPPPSDSATFAPLLLRQLQQQARQTDAGTFDLAVLDAVAGLFEFILDDPDVSPGYKSHIAQLQIPALRVALVSPDFFSDDQHPARQLIDLLGLFSRRFPERDPSHAHALAQVEAACTCILNDPDHQNEVFAQAHSALTAWLADENARAEAELAADVANMEQIERQELGTLLALENLNDLTARYPAPASVLRRLEAAWVPHMASLYVAEAGEGPDWRAAGLTLQQLFISLQPPDDDASRETLLQSIPHINSELRRVLLAQGSDPAHLKDFFGAITRAQEVWVRPGTQPEEERVSTFVPHHASREEIESLAHQLADAPPDGASLQQAQQLQEGDWVDFDPPFEGLTTARVAWVGVHGYLLFCNSSGEQRFSLDCDQLAAQIDAGHAHIPEQSLTRKAMLRLKSHLLPDTA